MPLPEDYLERVYAGVLGKIIGVYLGRPFEGWLHDRIMQELGEVWYYVHEKRGVPLIVTDDDISGTFTFLRAMPDYDNCPDLSPAQIGQTWLNYILEKRTILWWGGMGTSTEHTAYLRLKQGVSAPESGSIARNGKTVAEQIGAQIFIDGWGMIAPGDPEKAADYAYRAGSVSHDGEAIYGAQVVAAMEAQAFVESDIHALLDTAVRLIPTDSVIYRMIADIREWHTKEKDWKANYRTLAMHYGYDTYGGGCHIVPNHGLIILALLHGDGDFGKSLMIVNTCGWDTDCNSANVGCLLGIRNGLSGLEAGTDWRGPVADRLYLPTADGGRCITDAVRETVEVVNIGRSLAGLEPVAPKEGARFHFELPGSVQGFQVEETPEVRGIASLENVPGHSVRGSRSLALRFHHLAEGRAARAATATFIPPDALTMGGYSLIASPTLYPGQVVRAHLTADVTNTRAVTVRLYVQTYNAEDTLSRHYGTEVVVPPGEEQHFLWQIPDMEGYPIAEIGIEATSELRADGSLYLDYLTWEGTPNVTFRKTEKGTTWRRAWVSGMEEFAGWGEPFRLIQNEGIGLLIQGTREWTDYRVQSTITPHLTQSAGLAARVQGMRRYYALVLAPGNRARLVKALDGETVLAEHSYAWEFDQPYDFALEVVGNHLTASLNGEILFDITDTDRPLTGGAIAFLCEEGRIGADSIAVQPALR